MQLFTVVAILYCVKILFLFYFEQYISSKDKLRKRDREREKKRTIGEQIISARVSCRFLCSTIK